MRRLYLVVEGPTEERFTKALLEPHLRDRGLWTFPIIVTTRRERATGKKSRGGGHWAHWCRDIRRLLGEHPGDEVRFSTLFDLYGLPRDFPGLEEHAADGSTLSRIAKLEHAMESEFNDYRFIPYLQLHEFEALVLASLEPLAAVLDDGDAAGVRALAHEISGVEPEDVNDGATTAPSKRLRRHIPGYQKTLHGPLALEGLGISALREACPRFGAWIQSLEQLGTPSP